MTVEDPRLDLYEYGRRNTMEYHTTNLQDFRAVGVHIQQLHQNETVRIQFRNGRIVEYISENPVMKASQYWSI